MTHAHYPILAMAGQARAPCRYVMASIGGTTSPSRPDPRSGCARFGRAAVGTTAPVPITSTGQWRRYSFLELGALPGAVPCARLHARQLAHEWGLAALGDDLELLVSELLTNAVAAARAMDPVAPVRLWLLSDTRQIAVLVWDASPHSPAPTEIDDETESGRGLLLVEAISQRWGWYPAEDTVGKVVWALTEETKGGIEDF